MKKEKDWEAVVRKEHELGERAICKALQFLMRNWKLNGLEIAKLLHLSLGTVNRWLSTGRVPIGKPPHCSGKQAVLHLLAVHKNLYIMFTRPENQLAWLKTKHPQLNLVPFEKMGESLDGLVFIQRYLEFERDRGA